MQTENNVMAVYKKVVQSGLYKIPSIKNNYPAPIWIDISTNGAFEL